MSMMFHYHSPWMQLALDPGVFTRQAELLVREYTEIEKIEFKLTGMGCDIGVLYCVQFDLQCADFEKVPELKERLDRLFRNVDAVSDTTKQEVAATIARMFSKGPNLGGQI